MERFAAKHLTGGISVEKRRNHGMPLLQLLDQEVLMMHPDHRPYNEVGAKCCKGCVKNEKRDDEVQDAKKVVVPRCGNQKTQNGKGQHENGNSRSEGRQGSPLLREYELNLSHDQ